jgi:hypothetical protein
MLLSSSCQLTKANGLPDAVFPAAAAAGIDAAASMLDAPCFPGFMAAAGLLS